MISCKYVKLSAALAATAILGLSNVSPANAQALRSFILVNDTSETSSINISEDSGATFANVTAGRYKGSINGVIVNVLCNDLKHGISFGSGYTANVQYNITSPSGSLVSSYYQGGLASALTNGDFTTVSAAEANKRASENAWITDNFINSNAATYASNITGSTDLNTNLAALQFAMWDIDQDGGDGTAAGTVRLGASSAAYATEINYFLTQAALHTTYTSNTAYFIQGPSTAIGTHQQFFSAVVPEPSTYAMMFGMTMAGALFLRKRIRTRRK